MRLLTRGIAAVVLLSGIYVGFAASPASAAPARTITFSGHVSIRDYDSPDADDICERDVRVSNVADYQSLPQVRLESTQRCDEARVRIRFNASLNSSGTFTVSGSVKLDEEDWDGWDTVGWESVPTFTLRTGGLQSVTKHFDDGDQAATTVAITFSNSA